jgi:hypothetical protein
MIITRLHFINLLSNKNPNDLTNHVIDRLVEIFEFENVDNSMYGVNNPLNIDTCSYLLDFCNTIQMTDGLSQPSVISEAEGEISVEFVKDSNILQLTFNEYGIVQYMCYIEQKTYMGQVELNYNEFINPELYQIINKFNSFGKGFHVNRIWSKCIRYINQFKNTKRNCKKVY